jgi:hypothetical protein
MSRLIDVRLTVVGEENSLSRFERSGWTESLKARHIELFEHSRSRCVWWYQTQATSPFDRLASVSSRRARLVFLMDYEDQFGRVKGLARAKAGKIDHCQLAY